LIVKAMSKSDGRGRNYAREESPGSIEQGCRLTAGESDFKDSATENECLIFQVIVEMCGKSAQG